MSRNGSTRAWRRLRTQVIKEEPTCRIQLPGCTHISTTADHIIPVSIRPELELVRANCRGACAHCNYKRGAKTTQPKGRPRALDYFNTKKQ